MVDTIQNDDTFSKIFEPIIDGLIELEKKLEISAVLTLALVITAIIPIHPGIKILAGISEISGGAFAWTLIG